MSTNIIKQLSLPEWNSTDKVNSKKHKTQVFWGLFDQMTKHHITYAMHEAPIEIAPNAKLALISFFFC
jgi:hypothetical protein